MGQRGHGQIFPIFALLAAVAIAFVSLSIARSTDVAWVEPPRESPGKWNPALFKAFTSGQTASAIDALVLRFVTDPAYAQVQAGHHAAAFYDLDLATDLDPAFFELYIQGAGFLSVIRNDVDGAVELLEKGRRFLDHQLPEMPEEFRERVWSRPWSLMMMLGYVRLFEKQDLPAAREAFHAATKYPGCPPFVRSLVSRFEEPGRLPENGIRILEIQLASVKDERIREELLKHRRDLETVIFLRELNIDFVSIRPKTQTGLESFLSKRGLTASDPQGGRLFLDENGRIRSSTPLRHTLGIVD